jgi:carboxypeptidase T
VLFTCNQLAREHLTTEMCIHIVQRLTACYATDPAIKKLVDGHEIYLIPSVNPDGSEYDISGGRYHSWRKNLQGNGTDPNRNWSYKWGCCGDSSGSTTSETYRGTAAFSAPETKAVSDWVNSRKIGGVQQIKTHIDVHTYSELVLWPFGYTYNATAPGLTAAEAQKFKTLGQQMAATNGYTAEQSSGLYITDGDINDWMWGIHKILSYCFEMYPAGGSPGLLPARRGDRAGRNDKGVDLIVNAAV